MYRICLERIYGLKTRSYAKDRRHSTNHSEVEVSHIGPILRGIIKWIPRIPDIPLRISFRPLSPNNGALL